MANTNVCNYSLEINGSNWICCLEVSTDGEKKADENLDDGCVSVVNQTSYLASHVTDLPCFTEGWYMHTPNGAISYYKNNENYYYCQGGGTSPTTNTGCLPIAKIDTAVVASHISLLKTTNTLNGTILCSRLNNPAYKTGLILEPIIKFKTSIFKITGCEKKYYDYKFKQDTEFTIDLKDYSLNGFVKNGNYIETRDGHGYLSEKGYDNLVMLVPFNGIRVGSVNLLTTILSRQLIKAQCKCKNIDYVKTELKIGKKIMRGYYCFLVKKLEKMYNLNFNNKSDKKTIITVIDYLNTIQPFIKFMFANWYVESNEGTMFCRKLALKMVLVYNTLVKYLIENRVEMNDEMLTIYFDLMWKTLICCKKISIKKINALFYPFVKTNIFPPQYCIIFKKWFMFVEENMDINELSQIENAFDRLPVDTLLKANNCPTSPYYYLTLVEAVTPLELVRDKMHTYIRKITEENNTPTTYTISKEEKEKIIEKAMHKRLTHYTQSL